LANHLAHLDEPDCRITAWLRRWAPWFGDDRTTALIRAVTPKPLKWRADKLAQRLGLNHATRRRLGITTIGATDCGKAKRAALRRKRNNAAKRASRARAGAASHATSTARAKPWVALGISRRTYYRVDILDRDRIGRDLKCPAKIIDLDDRRCGRGGTTSCMFTG
jgi:hypothetical protein